MISRGCNLTIDLLSCLTPVSLKEKHSSKILSIHIHVNIYKFYHCSKIYLIELCPTTSHLVLVINNTRHKQERREWVNLFSKPIPIKININICCHQFQKEKFSFSLYSVILFSFCFHTMVSLLEFKSNKNISKTLETQMILLRLAYC